MVCGRSIKGFGHLDDGGDGAVDDAELEAADARLQAHPPLPRQTPPQHRRQGSQARHSSAESPNGFIADRLTD